MKYGLTKRTFLYEAVHKVIKSFNGGKSRWSEDIFLDTVHEQGRYSKDQEFLKVILNSDRPLFIGRLGAVELVAFLNYLQINGRLPQEESFRLKDYFFDRTLPNWWSVGSQRSMCSNAGFFPSNEETLSQWGGVMEEDLKEVDILLRWLKNEKLILPLNNEMNFLAYRNIEHPYLFKNPYIECFEGKRILVISPFSETIRHQYKNLEKIWINKKSMCPHYDLITLQSYNILGGERNGVDVNNWFDALNKMKEAISHIEFDIALIGCGAYAFHLAAHVKRLRKKAITTCGSTQLLFGIYGNRWENFLTVNNILNNYWTRPFDVKPKGYEKVENAAYW